MNLKDKVNNITTDQAVNYLKSCENHTDAGGHRLFCMTEGADSHSIDMEPCHTIYEFVTKLNDQIKQTLLMNTNNKVIDPANIGGGTKRYVEGAAHKHHNMFQNATGAVVNYDEPIAFFKIHMCADYTFEVTMNHAFAQNFYIKMSKALFNMLQFKEIENELFDRMNLPGRRFMGSRTINATSILTLAASKPNYRRSSRLVSSEYETASGLRLATPQSGAALTAQVAAHVHTTRQRTLDLGEITVLDYVTTFSSPVSAADTISRIKSLQFSSSLPTTSEGSTGGTYRRLLTDFIIPVNTNFSWNTDSLVANTVSENAACEYSYNNPNPSSGRLLMMLDPSPLYELKLSVKAKCWDFDRECFVIEPIPLPQGSTFSCKLVFISRNEISERSRPDKLLPH